MASDVPIYPLLMQPAYMHYLWGGGRIPRFFDRPPCTGTCAESWEISDRTEALSRVANGPLQGRSLRDILQTAGPEIIGAGYTGPTFPLLIKIIDAAQRLSVQVHPDDHAAARFGGEAKTEMWYVLAADPGAEILVGLREGCDRPGFERALAQGRMEEILHVEPALPGRVFWVPGGLVHAIGAGCLLLEVQQNSNTTYRVCDWGRVGPDGLPRELHVEKALQVIHWQHGPAVPTPPRLITQQGGNSVWALLTDPHFRVERLDLTAPESCAPHGQTFHALFLVNGAAHVSGNGVTAGLAAGTSCLIPAALDAYTIAPQAGPCTVLRMMRGDTGGTATRPF